jgi:hypothetical protein
MRRGVARGMNNCPEKYIHWRVADAVTREHESGTSPPGRADETATILGW